MKRLRAEWFGVGTMARNPITDETLWKDVYTKQAPYTSDFLGLCVCRAWTASAEKMQEAHCLHELLGIPRRDPDTFICLYHEDTDKNPYSKQPYAVVVARIHAAAEALGILED